eukprot:10214229-Heterocapsa_arctica.AAC.1
MFTLAEEGLARFIMMDLPREWERAATVRWMGSMGDDPEFAECGPLAGEEQASDSAEVRALVAALEKT